jgi:hypothetical protein
MVTEKDRYLFDCLGYVVVPGALPGDEVERLNGLLDEHRPWDDNGTAGSLLTLDPAFRSLLVHPSTFSHLEDFVGPDLRLDHSYGIYTDAGLHTPRLHHGGTPYIPSCSYQFADGRIYSGLTVVMYALVDHPAQQGAFVCIPGSHKANLRCPEEIAVLHDTDPIVHVGLQAGDALLFTEALTHGSWPWSAPHRRRALLFKYSPGHMAYAGVQWPDAVLDLMTPDQRRLFERPYVYERDYRRPVRSSK